MTQVFIYVLFYLYIVLTCIFYLRYITVYVRVDVIDGPMKLTSFLVRFNVFEYQMHEIYVD